MEIQRRESKEAKKLLQEPKKGWRHVQSMLAMAPCVVHMQWRGTTSGGAKVGENKGVARGRKGNICTINLASKLQK